MDSGVQSTDVFLQILEEFIDGLLILNEENEVIFVNAAFLKITHLKSQDVFGREHRLIRQIIDNTKTQTYDFTIFHGTYKHFKVSQMPLNSEHGHYTFIRIIPLTKRPEAELEIVKSHYDKLFDNVNDPLITVDLNDQIIRANTAFYILLDFDPSSPPQKISELYVSHKEIQEKIIELAENGTIYSKNVQLYTKDHKIKNVAETSWVLRNQNGIINGYITQFRDISYITDLKTRIKISEQNYLNLFDNILSSIIILDLDGIVANCNQAALELYNYKWEEMIGTPFDNYLCPSASDKISTAEITAILQKSHGRYVQSGVKRLCNNGNMKYTYASYSCIRNSENETVAYLIVEKDLTERVLLEIRLKESFNHIREIQSAAILGFAKLTEYRDKDTGNHLARIREYTRLLAKSLQELTQYAGYISEEYIEDLCLSSLLHDVGKVGIEDSILLKTGGLSRDEYNKIKEHTIMGGDALTSVDRELKTQSFLTIGKEVAYFHHERWDGSGYPHGRKGEDIPLSARIVALADVYDALTTKRPYKEAFSHEIAVSIIMKERGTHFDPDIVDVFVHNHYKFKEISSVIL